MMDISYQNISIFTFDIRHASDTDRGPVSELSLLFLSELLPNMLIKEEGGGISTY